MGDRILRLHWNWLVYYKIFEFTVLGIVGREAIEIWLSHLTLWPEVTTCDKVSTIQSAKPCVRFVSTDTSSRQLRVHLDSKFDRVFS